MLIQEQRHFKSGVISWEAFNRGQRPFKGNQRFFEGDVCSCKRQCLIKSTALSSKVLMGVRHLLEGCAI